MFTAILIQPIYNIFVLILGIVPNGDVGIAIILLTLIVRALFYPVFASSIRTQMALQAIQPELDELKEKYKGNNQEMVTRQAELFRKHRINLPSMFASLILQIVIFLSLSYVFFRLGLPHIRTDLLYPFVHAPQMVRENFIGLLNLTATHNAAIAILVAFTQYIVMRLSLQRASANVAKMNESQLAAHKVQQRMMQYMFPLAMAAAAYFPAAAVGLYLLVSNLISLGQEWLIRRKPL